MNSSNRSLMRRQVDRRLLPFRKLVQTPPPRSGWLEAIRQCLGMTAAQAAARAGVKQQNWTRAEAREADGSVTLAALQRYAQALDCQLVYGLVPLEESLEATLMKRAREVVTRTMRRTVATMEMEDQAIGADELREQIDEMARDLIRNLKSSLWEN